MSALADAARNLMGDSSSRNALVGPKPDPYVEGRRTRGRQRAKQLAPKINEAIRFWRGDQYCYVNKDNRLTQQSTVLDGTTKPRHRVRLTRNELVDPVEHEVSAATSRIPGYQCVPSTIDPEDASAARLAEKIARFGYDKWELKDVRERAVTYAIVAGMGFCRPYWDSTAGSVVDPAEGLHEGEVRVQVYGPNEVYWEPGIRFADSKWYCVERAIPVEDVVNLPGFLGGTPTADAQSADRIVNDNHDKPDEKNLVLVTEYLERPSSKQPNGRRLYIANGKVICTEEGYPCVGPDGRPLDEPVLHSLSRILDPSSDRDMGLVQHCIDAQRRINDCTNKQSEHKNLVLNPQILEPIGSIKTPITDEPGLRVKYVAVGGQIPQWREMPDMPSSLTEMKNEDMGFINRVFSQTDIPNQVDTARGVQAIMDNDANRRAGFVARLAEWDSKIMRHCLYLVQRHYQEPRLVKLNGTFGWDDIQDFRGTDLRGQADIEVSPQSIEPRTKEGVAQMVQNLATTFPGWLDPNTAIEAMLNGTAETIIESYERDKGRAWRIIQRIRHGDQALLNAQPPDPNQPPYNPNDPTSQFDPNGVPDWMPRPFDAIPIHKQIFEDWMKTQDYEMLAPQMKTAANLYYQALLSLEAANQAKQQAAQTAQAQQQGLGNAAAPQGPKPLPSQPALTPGP